MRDVVRPDHPFGRVLDSRSGVLAVRLERWAGPAWMAYLMTGIALACICVSGVLGSIFTADLVTGAQHQHVPIAAFTGPIPNSGRKTS
jgi:hypothetical protein